MPKLAARVLACVLATALCVPALQGCSGYASQRKSSSWEQGAPGSAYRIPSLFTVKRNFRNQSESDFLTVNLETYLFREDREADPASDADRAALLFRSKADLESKEAKLVAALRSSAEYTQAREDFTKHAETYAALLRTSGTRTAYERASQSREDRNRLIGDLMHLSERIAVIHLSSILALEDRWEIGLGVTATSLAGLAAVLDPSGTTRGLAAGSALANATGDLIRSEIYAEVLATAILRACEDDRQEQRRTIEGKLDKPISDYPIDLALLDVAEYHKRGSFWHGVSIVVERASTPEELAALRAESKRKARLGELSVKQIEIAAAVDRERQRLGSANSTELTKAWTGLATKLNATDRDTSLAEIEALLDASDGLLDSLRAPPPSPTPAPAAAPAITPSTNPIPSSSTPSTPGAKVEPLPSPRASNPR